MGEQPTSLHSVLQRSANIFFNNNNIFNNNNYLHNYCVKGQAVLQELSSSSRFLVQQFSKDVSQAWTQRDSADNWSPVSLRLPL